MNRADLAAALRAVAGAIVEAVSAAGSLGAPAGIVYAALMAHGCTLEQFNALISGMQKTGHIRRDGDLLFATGKQVPQ